MVVSATFLSIASPTVLSEHGAFWLYAFIAILGWFWVNMVMPETAGLSLEEVESLFEKGTDSNRKTLRRRGNSSSRHLMNEVEQNVQVAHPTARLF